MIEEAKTSINTQDVISMRLDIIGKPYGVSSFWGGLLFQRRLDLVGLDSERV